MNHIQFDFKARYEALGNIDNPKRIWIVVHGYGQQAQYFIRKFKPLQDEDTLVIAPEGLHHFYLKGFNGRVGASWMTKEDRWTDIDNYLSYLNAIYKQVIFPLVKTNTEVNLLGFSQGAATASRWLNEGKVNFHKFVLWSSVFPPDLNFDLFGTQLATTKTYFVYGNEDEFMPASKIEAFKTKLNDMHIDIEYIDFDGPHDIDGGTLLKL